MFVQPGNKTSAALVHSTSGAFPADQDPVDDEYAASAVSMIIPRERKKSPPWNK